MSKNRTIPFGYMMQNGIITTDPAEVLAVLTIFSEYMAGKSLDTIAKNMGVPYNDGMVWNKNMVKRVLENEKYLGTDTYPQLISEEIFRAVNERKGAKATALCIVPDELQEVRNLTVCKECSKRLFRTKAELWDCRNKECHPFLFKLTDEMLTGAVLNILNTVIANPTLIEAEAVVSEYIPTSEILCKQTGYKMSRGKMKFFHIKKGMLTLTLLETRSDKNSICDYAAIGVYDLLSLRTAKITDTIFRVQCPMIFI